MSLQEKIIYCRRRAGLSQEGLAEKLEVSRQAVSKWETGEAVPEINKLLSLARIFNVTTDWLLSGEEPKEEPKSQTYDETGYSYNQEAESIKTTEEKARVTSRVWINTILGTGSRFYKRYGWIYGVYMAIGGFAFSGLGVLARYLVRVMAKNVAKSSQIDTIGNFLPENNVFMNSVAENFKQQTNAMQADFFANNPVSIMGTVFIIIGVIIMIAGISLAIYLKKRYKNTEQA